MIEDAFKRYDSDGIDSISNDELFAIIQEAKSEM